MDTHSCAGNGAHSMQWKTQALQHRGPFVLQEKELVMHVQYIACHQPSASAPKFYLCVAIATANR